MKNLLVIGMALGTLCGGESIEQRIRVYNLANVPAATLKRARTTAGQLLEGAGVAAIWEEGSIDALEARISDQTGVPAPAPDRRGYLVVRIIRGLAAQFHPGAIGFALPFVRQGAHAIVCYDRAQTLQLSLAVGPTVDSILGAAMAHELGHVLLGSDSHSCSGIMKAHWGEAELRLLACRKLQFTPENAAAISQKLFARSQPVNRRRTRVSPTQSGYCLGWPQTYKNRLSCTPILELVDARTTLVYSP